MFKAILIDDEELSLEQLSYVLQKQQDVEICGSYTDPVEALAVIKKTNPDILFVDVSMPCINGFQLAKEIQNEGLRPYIVFVTAFREYAINAFEVEAVDYVQKPFLGERIDMALDKIRRRASGEKECAEKQGKLGGNNGKKNTSRQQGFESDISWFPVVENESIKLLHVNDVYYCSVDNKTTLIYSKDKSYPINYTLSKIEENYSSKLFFRCHKSFIVNLNHVEKIIPLFKQNHIIKLKNFKEEIPVSRHYVKKLKSLLQLEGSPR